MESRAHRILPDLVGVIGNERLTTIAGLLLAPLLVAEVLTLLSLSTLLPEHLFIGLWLVLPLGLKMASTGYRFTRYYTGDPEYVKAGAPRLAPRVLAPVLVLATVVLVGSGVGLWAIGPPGNGFLLLLHKVSFQVWWISAVAHVLLHLGHIRRDTVSDFVKRERGYLTRGGLATGAIVVGLLIAISLLWVTPAWPAGSVGG